MSKIRNNATKQHIQGTFMTREDMLIVQTGMVIFRNLVLAGGDKISEQDYALIQNLPREELVQKASIIIANIYALLKRNGVFDER